VPCEDLVAPRDDGVDDIVKLDELAASVEIGESVQRFEGGVSVTSQTRTMSNQAQSLCEWSCCNR